MRFGPEVDVQRKSNVVFAFPLPFLAPFPQVLFNMLTDVSGSSLLDPFSLMSYNMIFTAVPILFFVLDRDRERDSLLTNPKHYLEVGSTRHTHYAYTCVYVHARVCVCMCICLCMCICA